MIRWNALLVVAAAFVCTSIAAQERAAIDDRFKWSLTEIFASDDAWDMARLEVLRDIAKLAAPKDRRLRSAARLYETLALRDRIRERASRVSAYASMRHDLDTREGRTQQMNEQAREANVALDAASAWIRPAILAVGTARVRRFIDVEPRLAPYRQPLEDTLRFTAHTLDARGEGMLAQAGLIADAGEAVSSVFTNADLPWPTVTLWTGEKVVIDQSAYEKHRESTNRDDRTTVFRAFFGAYSQFTRTLGTTLNAQIQSHAFMRTTRDYESSLHAALFRDNIKVKV